MARLLHEIALFLIEIPSFTCSMLAAIFASSDFFQARQCGPAHHPGCSMWDATPCAPFAAWFVSSGLGHLICAGTPVVQRRLSSAVFPLARLAPRLSSSDFTKRCEDAPQQLADTAANPPAAAALPPAAAALAAAALARAAFFLGYCASSELPCPVKRPRCSS